MTIRKHYSGVWMQGDVTSVSRMIAEMAMESLGFPTDDFRMRDKVIARICSYVDHVLNQAELIGRESVQENIPSDVPSFQSMVSLQIEKIKAAKTIVKSMDEIKEACAKRGLDVEFSESMASAYETALKFLEGQLTEESSIQVNIEVPE